MSADEPHIRDDGTLVIPTRAPKRYAYWAGGQSLEMTLVELGADEEIWKRYTERPYMDCPEFHPPSDG